MENEIITRKTEISKSNVGAGIEGLLRATDYIKDNEEFVDYTLGKLKNELFPLTIKVKQTVH